MQARGRSVRWGRWLVWRATNGTVAFSMWRLSGDAGGAHAS